MKLRIYHRSDPGMVRASNQDACSIDMLDPRGIAAILLVADGMGGYEGGEIASHLAVDTVRNRVIAHASDWAEKGSLEEGLVESIGLANEAILAAQQGHPEIGNMGTTMTAALIWGDRVIIGHVGDSKAYMINLKKAQQITHDHNIAGELLDSGHLTADQAAVHPQRHVLTRGLGIGGNVNVERHNLTWTSEDMLVLTTDGLSNLVRINEIQQLAAESSFEELPDRLVALANERGGHDNITVLVARWEG